MAAFELFWNIKGAIDGGYPRVKKLIWYTLHNRYTALSWNYNNAVLTQDYSIMSSLIKGLTQPRLFCSSK